MAQLVTSTADAGNYDQAWARATLNAVRSRLLGSKTIRAQDIRDIINVYNAWAQHNHSVYDQYYIQYGNIPPYGTQGAWTATGLPILSDLVNGVPLTNLPRVAAGSNIVLDDIRNLMALINAIRSHSHHINDGYL